MEDILALQTITDQILKQKTRAFNSIIIANQVIKDSNTKKAKYYMKILLDLEIVEPIYKKYGDKGLEAIRHSYNLEKFLEKGGFEEYFRNKETDIKNNEEFTRLKKENLVLNNEKLEYEKTIRALDKRIKELTAINLFWSLLQKYWWAIGIIFGIGILIGRFSLVF